MKTSKKILAIAVSLVALSLTGCIPSDEDDGDNSPTAELNTVAIDRLGVSAAEVIPGCAYSGENGATPVNSKNISSSIKIVQSFVKETGSKKILRTHDIYNSTNGECGGTLVQSGLHDNGDDRVTYTFTNYCTYDSDLRSDKTVLNGSYEQFSDGTPSANGPVINSISASTKGNGITATTTSNGVSSTETVYLSNYVMTPNGNNPSTTIGKMSVTSNGKTYEVLNTAFSVDGNGKTTLTKATYIDPDNGPLQVSIRFTGDKPVITLTGNGSSATFTDVNNDGNYQVTQGDGSVVGSLDCSAQALL